MRGGARALARSVRLHGRLGLSPGGTVVVAGSVAQRPGNGGHAWVFLQYLLGFQKLGRPVLFLDRLEPEMCVDSAGRQSEPEESINVEYLQRVLEGFSLADRYSVLCPEGRTVGLTREQVLDEVAGAALVLNVNGFIDDEEILGRARLRVFLDIDPGFPHMWRALGLHDAFRGHDAYVTVGESIGRPECSIPTGGRDWITTPQPVVLDHWPVAPLSGAPGEPDGSAFSSVGSWRGPFGTIEYEGVTYGLRVHEFRKFADLPRLVEERLELALDIDDADETDLELLRSSGWSLVNPREAAADPWRYRKFVQGSRAEFMVAKNIYVRSQSGWFSDRSICYLASGKPVLAQETGFSRHHPVGRGLLAFRTLEEAAAGVREIAADYDGHCRAARALAEERFSSDRILPRLLSELRVA
jgi:hypothetical protein